MKGRGTSNRFLLAAFIFLFLIILGAFLIKGPPEKPHPADQMESFTLIYTSNLQGRLLKATVNESIGDTFPADFTTLFFNLMRLKAEGENRREPVLVVDLGNSLCGDEDLSWLEGGLPIARLMNEIPYSCMLCRENEYALGSKNLARLPKELHLLGAGVRFSSKIGSGDKGSPSPAYIKPGFVCRAGNLKVAVFGYFDKRSANGIGKLQSKIKKIKADIKILLLSVPNPVDFSRKFRNIDLIIPAEFHPELEVERIAVFDDVSIAPPVDSRFQIGKIRFNRIKGEKKWKISAAVEKIRPADELPPGSILNIVLDISHKIEIAYRGRYQAIYDSFAIWMPDEPRRETIARWMGKALATYGKADYALIDMGKIRTPSDNCWGSKEILNLPGKSLKVAVAIVEQADLNDFLKRNPNLIAVTRTTPVSEKSPGISLKKGKITIIADDTLIRKTPSIFNEPLGLSVLGNYILLDFFRKNRGVIYIESGGDPKLGEICRLMDQWKYEQVLKFSEKSIGRLKKRSRRDMYMLLGMAGFKSKKLKKALEYWKKALKLDNKNRGIGKILNLVPSENSVSINNKAKGESPWPKFRGNLKNTGFSPIIGPSSPLLKWKFDTDSKIISSTALGKDGTIYVGCEDRHLYTIDSAGRLKWRFKTGLPVRSSPALDSDGTIYVGSDDKFLYALSPSGKLIWKFPGGFFFSSSPAIGKDGTIYAGCEDNHLYAISKEGKLKWKYKTGGPIFSSPALDSKGSIYIGSQDHYLYKFSPDGRLIWKFKTGHKINSTPAIGKKGIIYVGSEDRCLYAINALGKLMWKTATGNYITASPALGLNNIIYIGSEDKHLYAVSTEGKILWKLKTGGEIISSPLIDGRGTIYFGSDDGILYALNERGKIAWKFMTRDPVMSSPAIGSDGTIFIGSEDGNIYAIGK